MEINEIITFITNNGIAVVLMVYFLRNNHKSTQELINKIQALIDINKDLINELKFIKEDQKTVLKVIEKCNIK
jgi:hypothetical protein